jgi:hypothetical protein
MGFSMMIPRACCVVPASAVTRLYDTLLTLVTSCVLVGTGGADGTQEGHGYHECRGRGRKMSATGVKGKQRFGSEASAPRRRVPAQLPFRDAIVTREAHSRIAPLEDGVY